MVRIIGKLILPDVYNPYNRQSSSYQSLTNRYSKVPENVHQNLIVHMLTKTRDYMIYCNDRVEWRLGSSTGYINDLSENEYIVELNNEGIDVNKKIRFGFLNRKIKKELMFKILKKDILEHESEVYNFLINILIDCQKPGYSSLEFY